MAILTKNASRLIQDQVAVMQGASTTRLDFTVGSILRAIVEAVASVALWLQAEIIRVMLLTRAATSKGPDLDSWVGDYGLTRMPARASTGLATFSRFTATAQAVVPVGAQVETADGSQIFTVYADSANSAYDPVQGGYVLGIGVASLPVPVQAAVAGSAGNVVANAISLLLTGIIGVDTVANAADFTNGFDAESDAALRLRFVAFLLSLSKGTRAAVLYAASLVQQGLQFTLTENQNLDGSPNQGYFYVVVDDGSGNPPNALLVSVYTAIDVGLTVGAGARPVGSTFGVFAPTVITVSVNCTITTAIGYDHNIVVGQVATAIKNFINRNGLGNLLSYTKLAQIIFEASPGVTNVQSLLLNGDDVDVAASSSITIKSGIVTVS
jgi:uncharacterized phage protein gp47/JayE